MATVSTEVVDGDGLDATYNAASGGGDKFTPGDQTFIHIENGGGGAITATITTPNSVLGLAITDRTVAVPAGEDRFSGPFPSEHFAGSDGLVDISWSGTTSVTFAVLRT